MDFAKHHDGYGVFRAVDALPPRQVLTFKDFRGGYISNDGKSSVPANASPHSVDMEVTIANRLRRSPGTTLVEQFTTHLPRRMEIQQSLDDTAELLLFAAPWMGVKQYSTTQWTNEGLFDGDINGVNFGGVFLFTDGVRVYAREANGTTLEVLTDAPVGFTYTSFAGRAWSADCIIDGRLEPLGLRWSDPDSDYHNWSPLNFELLVDEQVSGRRIVSLNPIGLDNMAIVMRSALWVARRTGIAERPADFRLVESGIGGVNRRVTKSTPLGVITLSDVGVIVFDGNSYKKISPQIDDDILPLDTDNIDEYSSTYDPVTLRYMLHTPDGRTFVYELERDRWSQRTLPVYDSAILPEQIDGVRWNEVIDEWGEQTLPWYLIGPSSGQRCDILFIGDRTVSMDEVEALDKEDYASFTYFGKTVNPVHEFQLTLDQKINHLLSVKNIAFQFLGAGAVELWTPNVQGDYDKIFEETLASTAYLRTVSFPTGETGLGESARIRLGATSTVELRIMQLQIQSRGPKLEGYSPSSNAGGTVGGDGTFFNPTTGDGDYDPLGDAADGIYSPPTVSLDADSIETTGRYRRRFTPIVDEDETLTYEWDFGDGGTSTAAVPVHTYVGPGTYRVKVRVTRDDGVSWGYGYNLIVPFTEEVPPPDPVDIPLDSGGVSQGVGFTLSWSTIHDGVGDNAFDYGDADISAIVNYTDPDGWNTLERAWIAFNNSAMDQFESASITIPAYVGYAGTAVLHKVRLLVFLRSLTGLPANVADFQNALGAVIKASDTEPEIDIEVTEEFTYVTENFEFPLNAAGLAHLNAGGLVHFALRLDFDALDQDIVAEFTGSAFHQFSLPIDSPAVLHAQPVA